MSTDDFEFDYHYSLSPTLYNREYQIGVRLQTDGQGGVDDFAALLSEQARRLPVNSSVGAQASGRDSDFDSATDAEVRANGAATVDCPVVSVQADSPETVTGRRPAVR